MRREDPAPGTAGPGLGRRRLLAAGIGTAAAAVLAGCSLNNPYDSTKTPASQAVDDLSPDVALAVTAVGLLLQTDAHARAAVAAFPGLRPALAGVLAVHAAHLAALRAAVPAGVDPAPTTSPTQTPRTRPAALRAQRTHEAALHDQLVGLALRAESGAFARLLGTMAAAVSQQLVVLGPGGTA